MIRSLSPSSIRMFLRCAEQFRRVYIDGDRVPPAGAVHMGRAFHSALEANHRQKVATRADLPVDELEDRFAQAFDAAPPSEILWENDDPAPKLKDDGVALIDVYARVAAPQIQPVLVEEKVNIELGAGLPDLHTRLDVVDDHQVVDDYKTARKLPRGDAADCSDQLTAYAIALRARSGRLPSGVRLRHFIRPSPKYSLGRYFEQPSLRTSAQADTYLVNVRAVASQVQHAIDTGLFPYADPDSFWCSESMCGFYGRCPGGAARRVSIVQPVWPGITDANDAGEEEEIFAARR